MVFSVFEAMKHHNETLQCYQIDVIEELIEVVSRKETPSSLVERVLVQSIEVDNEEENKYIIEFILQLQGTQIERANKKFKELGGSSEEKKPMVPELKEPLKHLK